MRSFAVFLSVLMMLTLAACGGHESSRGNTETISSHSGSRLKWSSDWDGSLKKAQTKQKMVLVNFYADWCVWCKKLEKSTFSDPAVSAYLQEHVVPVRLDVEAKGKARSREYRVQGLPTVVILNGKGKEIGRISGYLPPDAFLERVKRIFDS